MAAALLLQRGSAAAMLKLGSAAAQTAAARLTFSSPTAPLSLLQARRPGQRSSSSAQLGDGDGGGGGRGRCSILNDTSSYRPRAFLAQSMKESIKYNACDENSWDLVNCVYPLSNASIHAGSWGRATRTAPTTRSRTARWTPTARLARRQRPCYPPRHDGHEASSTREPGMQTQSVRPAEEVKGERRRAARCRRRRLGRA